MFKAAILLGLGNTSCHNIKSKLSVTALIAGLLFRFGEAMVGRRSEAPGHCYQINDTCKGQVTTLYSKKKTANVSGQGVTMSAARKKAIHSGETPLAPLQIITENIGQEN